MIDSLIQSVRRPFELLCQRIWGIRNVGKRARGDWNRMRALPGELEGELQHNAKAARALGHQAKSLGNRTLTGAHGDGASSKKGLFSKKNCPYCGEKIKASWELCPCCGLRSSAAVALTSSRTQTVAADAQAMDVIGRTLALDSLSDVGGVGGVGWLVPLEGLQTGELFQLKGRCVVGTAPSCDVVLRDSSISGRHAELVISAANCRIQDLGSTNGTYVNDQRVTISDLIDNDSVRLGQTRFKFKAMS